MNIRRFFYKSRELTRHFNTTGAILLFLLLSQSSCKKFLEIDAPKDQLATENVFLLNETAIAAMTSIYSAMVNAGQVSPSTLARYTGTSADELANNNNGQDFVLMYRNDNLATGGLTSAYWEKSYNLIFQANAVYEGCEVSNALDPDIKKQLMAEARFIRAYWFFNLLNLFGDMPLTLTTDYKINSALLRMDVATVNSQIISDLLYAKANLNERYVNANSFSTSDDRIRPNKATASALLSRVYLYSKRYLEAEVEASNIIEKTDMYSLPGLDDVFLKNSKETIWALTPTTPNTRNTPEGADFVISSTPFTSAQPTLTDQLRNAFDSTDLRKDKWIGIYKDITIVPNVDHYYPHKYKITTGQTINEYSILFRLAEQFLIRAEARAQQNDLSGAIADLDALRQRAYNPFIATDATSGKDALLTFILNERRLELFSEQGHRWFDLKRTSTIDAIMSAQALVKNAIWKSPKQLWPIPQFEILNNSKITQNESYN
jgi:starch-binding outer membrane protein, SusD/RagB family